MFGTNTISHNQNILKVKRNVTKEKYKKMSLMPGNNYNHKFESTQTEEKLNHIYITKFFVKITMLSTC